MSYAPLVAWLPAWYMQVSWNIQKKNLPRGGLSTDEELIAAGDIAKKLWEYNPYLSLLDRDRG